MNEINLILTWKNSVIYYYLYWQFVTNSYHRFLIDCVIAFNCLGLQFYQQKRHLLLRIDLALDIDRFGYSHLANCGKAF